MVFSVEDNILRALVNDLEMSFGKVEAIHETQFCNAAINAGMAHDMADELSYLIGLKTAPNHELPAIIVIEKVRENIKGTESVPVDPFVQHSPKVSPVSEPETVKESPKTPEMQPRFTSFIDMNMIKISPNGYVGSFLDRHLVYTIEDQNRVINLEHGARTCQVLRRFSDFVAVRDYLITKYSFKCIPRLPAKRVQMFSDEAFLLDRQKSLRRFLGIISHHHIYKNDPLIQAFIYNQKEYQNLISDSKFVSPDREHMLLTQIPSADALVRANMKDAINAVEGSRAESQSLAAFCAQIRDQVKALIDTFNRESNCLTKLASTLIKSEEVTKSLCLEKCSSCAEDEDLRKSLSSKLSAVNETTENSIIVEFEEIVEKLNLLIDLFESYAELVQRANATKFNDFDEIRKEIGVMEVEMEKKRGTADGAETTQRLQMRIDALKQQWDEQDTFNKFIQYSLFDEMQWVHSHKVMIKHLLDQFSLMVTLKQRQWIATFESK